MKSLLPPLSLVSNSPSNFPSANKLAISLDTTISRISSSTHSGSHSYDISMTYANIIFLISWSACPRGEGDWALRYLTLSGMQGGWPHHQQTMRVHQEPARQEKKIDAVFSSAPESTITMIWCMLTCYRTPIEKQSQKKRNTEKHRRESITLNYHHCHVVPLELNFRQKSRRH